MDGRGHWPWAVLLGAAIGLGALSKYAMFYFVLGLAIAAAFDPKIRRAVLGVNTVIILAVAAVIFAPNVIWNLHHHFATVSHTAANANWSHATGSLANFAGFVAGQFGVFGPILMAAYLYGAWQAIRGRDPAPQPGRLLAAFSLPILLIITVQSFISEANANWAAAAYVAATPLAVHTILTAVGRWAAWSSAAIHALALAALATFAVSPAAVEAAGLANAYKRFHGWRELGTEVVRQAAAAPYQAVVVDNRSVTASLLYYARPMATPILVWDANGIPDNHFQMTLALTPAVTGRVLIVSDARDPERELQSFAHARLTRTVSVPLGGAKVRSTKFFDADGYRRPNGTSSPSE
jgi:4-amino-4-deoxy-L-arabinose transferase-like glycosyltransferase